MSDTENYSAVLQTAIEDVDVLIEKGKTYGSSWRNRGGAGAFFMLSRKWDRIENQVKRHKYDIFQAIECSKDVDGFLDDIRDLRRYLLLCDAHLSQVKLKRATVTNVASKISNAEAIVEEFNPLGDDETGAADERYTNQD